MSIKKFSSVILIILMTATIFSGCTRNERAVSGAGGGITIIVVLEALDHFTSIASNTGVLLKNNSDAPAPSVQSELPKKSEIVEKNELPEKIETQDKPTEVDEKISKKLDEKTPAPPIAEKIPDSGTEVKYRRFTDKNHEFAFDYPVEGDKSLIVEKDFEQSNYPAGQAMYYYHKFEHSKIIIGVDFADMPKSANLGYVANNLVGNVRGVNREDMKINVEKLGEGIFLLTWVDPAAREDYIQKSFFGKTHYSKQEHHYIKYIYNQNTPATEKAVAQHMIETFDSGFEE